MVNAKRKVLIVGLGNPGSVYETTRHNVGQAIVSCFGHDHKWVFHDNKNVKGKIASGMIDDTLVYLLIPTTFMNNSGLAVERAMKFFEIDILSVLVIADDIHFDFGKFRFREKGSSGGHNGLKSVEAHLLSQEYARLRIGIGDRFIGSLEEHVLSDFNESELGQMPEIITRAKACLHYWIIGEREMTRELAGSKPVNTQGENE